MRNMWKYRCSNTQHPWSRIAIGRNIRMGLSLNLQLWRESRRGPAAFCSTLSHAERCFLTLAVILLFIVLRFTRHQTNHSKGTISILVGCSVVQQNISLLLCEWKYNRIIHLIQCYRIDANASQLLSLIWSRIYNKQNFYLVVNKQLFRKHKNWCFT